MKTLTYERQVEILSDVADIADDSDTLAKALKDRGFSSFQAWPAYESSFFEPNEMEDYLKSDLAIRKTRVRSPAALLPKIEDKDRAKFYMFDARYRLLSLTDPVRKEERREALHEIFFEYRKQERIIFGTVPPKTESLEYYDYFKQIMIDKFGPLGFETDQYRSKLKFPVIYKPLTSQWDLCWSTGAEPAVFYYWPQPVKDKSLHIGPERLLHMNHLELLCYVRYKKSRGSVRVPLWYNESSMMLLRLNIIVPGFGWAYMIFNGVEELPLVVSAHAYLYSLIKERLEAILVQALQNDV